MAKEIERKFRVNAALWTPLNQGESLVQGYLSRDPERTVRVRVVGGDKACLTIKGLTRGVVRDEYEYPIPVEDAQAMLLTLCEGSVIKKVRHTEQHNGLTVEIDVFSGAHNGLIIAEVESETEQESLAIDSRLPAFIGEDVSADPRFFNSKL